MTERTKKPGATYGNLSPAQVKMSPAPACEAITNTLHSDSNPTQSLSRQSTLVNTELDALQSPQQVHSLAQASFQNTCSLDCICACHRKNRLKSPEMLSILFGSLLVGYKALPCDRTNCRNQATTITYAFPQWLLRRTIALSVSYSRLQGPNLCLRMVRNCPGDADIFTAVFRGQVDHVRRLLGNGEASVIDVDPAGNTPLHVRCLSSQSGSLG